MIIPNQNFYLFYISFLLIATVERISNTFINKQTKATQVIYYKWFFYLLLFSYLFSVLLSIGELFLFTKEVKLSVSVLGLIIYGCGVLLRRKAIADLGSNWSVYIEIKEDHEIISDGIYKMFKHPYYLAVVLELVGVCFIANAFFAIIFVFLFHVPLLVTGVILEQRKLGEYFMGLRINEKNKGNSF